ncbi:conserved hypothetical protein [Altererythrobacter sp. B11]|nr:conserved hypothetical protein [Altererythrobacter sp. B11]
MMKARSGAFDAAAAHLLQAHQARPADITIACNLISVLMDAGRNAEALAIASQELAAADATGRVARYRGFLAQTLEQFDTAILAYEAVLANAPDDFECWNNLGNARIAIGDAKGAVEALRRAVALDPAAAPTRLNLASALEDADEAAAVLRQAARDFPTDPRPPYQLYILFKQQSRQEDALAAIEEAVARDPDVAGMQLKLAVEYGVVRRTAEAEECYRKVIALDPGAVDAYLGLAIQYEHTNREEEFAPLLALARANGIGDGPCSFIEAFELRRAGRFEEALAMLERVPPDIEPVRTAHARASVLDRLGRSADAFTAFSEANALMGAGSAEPLQRAAKLREEIARQIGLLTPEWRDSWQVAAPADPLPDPVFLVGFPRSGTTLLDTILMGHPDTVVMEEQPPLNVVEDSLGDFTAIAHLDADGITRARARYFEEVARLNPVPPGKLLIDKSPLFLYRLPLIHRLFPQARIILALRHPCDVVLSCFMSNFRLNSAMANFLRLEDAASLYDLCFRHFEASQALFPVDCHHIVYERLVEDVEAEVRPLLDWLGLEWTEDVLEHRRTAKARGLITTASYSQVTEPIYRRAAGRWKRYEQWLAPQMDALSPWIEKFGYSG